LKRARPPLWSCEACGALLYTAEEKQRHEEETGHSVARLPAWRMLALSMQADLLELAKEVAERKGLKLEDYLKDVEARAGKQALDRLAVGRIVWLDALKLGLVRARGSAR
jgi:hypothetical protein